MAISTDFESAIKADSIPLNFFDFSAVDIITFHQPPCVLELSRACSLPASGVADGELLSFLVIFSRCSSRDWEASSGLFDVINFQRCLLHSSKLEPGDCADYVKLSGAPE